MGPETMTAGEASTTTRVSNMLHMHAAWEQQYESIAQHDWTMHGIVR